MCPILIWPIANYIYNGGLIRLYDSDDTAVLVCVSILYDVRTTMKLSKMHFSEHVSIIKYYMTIYGLFPKPF
jgi:hypothetical protein